MRRVVRVQRATTIACKQLTLRTRVRYPLVVEMHDEPRALALLALYLGHLRGTAAPLSHAAMRPAAASPKWQTVKLMRNGPIVLDIGNVGL